MKPSRLWLPCLLVLITVSSLTGCGSDKAAVAGAAGNASGIPSANVKCGDEACVK